MNLKAIILKRRIYDWHVIWITTFNIKKLSTNTQIKLILIGKSFERIAIIQHETFRKLHRRHTQIVRECLTHSEILKTADCCGATGI